MALPNLHRKLFANNGSDKLLREDIIPWSESPYGSVPIVSKHFTTASPISSGEAVSTHGCGYKFGENALMVFMDGLCLDEGAHYAEAESGEEITLLFDCQAGVVFEFVAHDGYEYEYTEPEPDEGDGTLEVGESITYHDGSVLYFSGGFVLLDTVLCDEYQGVATADCGAYSVEIYGYDVTYTLVSDDFPDAGTDYPDSITVECADGKRYLIEATDEVVCSASTSWAFTTSSGAYGAITWNDDNDKADLRPSGLYGATITRLEDADEGGEAVSPTTIHVR